MTATYTKLKSGNWGIRVQGEAKAGDYVSVTKKDGTTKTERIERVVWTGNGISLCAIKRAGGYGRSRRYGSDGLRDAYRHGWDGRIGSPSYYSSGAFDELDM